LRCDSARIAANHRGFGSSAEHDVGPAEPDRVESVADRHVRGRARRALGAERAARPEHDRNPPRTEIRDDRRNRERVDAVGAAMDERVVALLERADAADTRRDRGTDAVGLGPDVETGVLLRLEGGGEDEMREAVHAPRVLAVDPLRRVEVLDLAGEVHLVVGVVELRDLAGPRVAVEQPPPGRLGVVSERRHRAQPRDDDAPPPVE
jgi:hypothetical protein